MFDFPNAPTPGQNYNGYIWDGEKWTTPVAAATTSGYVLKGGDVMTGNLTISKPSAAFVMDTTDTGQIMQYMTRKGSPRWLIYTQNEPEAGGNSGSSFGIGRCGDNGAYIDTPISISRADGKVSISAPNLPNHAVTKAYVDAANYNKVNRAGDTMTGPLIQLGGGQWRYASPGAGSYYDTVSVPNRFFVGTDTTTDAWRIFSQGKGANVMTVDGTTGQVTFPYGANFGAISFGDLHARDIYASRGDGTGVYYFAGGGNLYLYWDGGKFNFSGGPVYAGEFRTNATGTSSLTFDGTNTIIKSGAATVFQRNDGLQYGAIDANALIVYSPAIYLNSTPCFQRSGNYTNIYDSNSNIKFSIGNNNDPQTLHRNTVYKFQSPDGLTDFMTLADGGITVNKTLSAGTAINAGSSIYSGDTITAGGGAIILNSKPGGNCQMWCRDENGTTQMLWYWDRASNRSIWLYPNAGTAIAINGDGGVALGWGFQGRQGQWGGGYQSVHNFFWTGALQAWVDRTYVGDVYLLPPSDYRVKKDVQDLPSMWDRVKALRPIKYTHKEFTPPGSLKKKSEEKLPKGAKQGPLVADDDAERWGFNAHELQETLVPTAASLQKDAEDAIQSPNPMTVITALTKALQEAMARIEALEGKLA